MEFFALIGLALFVVLTVTANVLARLSSAGKTAIGSRDTLYANVPPGVIPRGALEAPTRPATKEDVTAPVAVRFEPPQGVAPDQVGILTHARVGSSDVAAAMVSLAVDGYLQLRPVRPPLPPTASERARRKAAKAKPEWLVTAVREPDPATVGPLRAGLWHTMTALGRPATLTELRDEIRGRVPELIKELAAVPTHRTWYPAMKPDGSFPTFGKGASQRTPLGAALRYQSAGFAHFLETADGDRLRFEGGAGIFSRYLPWAIAYGISEHWVQAFRQALAATDPTTMTIWAGDLAWYGDFGAFDPAVCAGLEPGMFDALLADLAGALDGFTDGVGDLVDDLTSDVGDTGGAGDSGGDGGDGGGDGGGGGD